MSLPRTNTLQSSLTGRHRRPLWCLGLGICSEVVQTHAHQCIGRCVGLKWRKAGIRAAVRVCIRCVIVRRITIIGVWTRVHSVRGVVTLWSRQTRLAIPDQHGHGHSPGWRRMVVSYHFQCFVLTLSLAFISAVLKPNFDLRRCQFQGARQMFSLWSR